MENKKPLRVEPTVAPAKPHWQVVCGNNSGDGIPSDICGSYTGTSATGETPQQDADDL